MNRVIAYPLAFVVLTVGAFVGLRSGYVEDIVKGPDGGPLRAEASADGWAMLKQARALVEEGEGEAAVSVLQQSYAQGVGAAARDLGEIYRNGGDTLEDPVAARLWFTRASDAGDRLGAFRAGEMLEQGLGGPKDVAGARRHYERAFEHGMTRAAQAMGDLWLHSADPPDPRAALTWYRRGAEAGDRGSLYRLGEMYLEGRGVEADAVEAIGYLRRAAEKEFSPAKFRLGEIYRDGEHVPADVERAAGYFEQAADQGYGRAREALKQLRRLP